MTRHRWLLVLAVVLAMTLVACGGGGSDPADNPVIGTHGVTTTTR